ncbi:16S rRNA (adenine(1518)-N(6)/adenine(1519)-N(6))-dimethyltransferase RsmA [Caldithrix abyssi]
MRPLKRFSQNFLTNPFYQQKIVDGLNIEPEDVVVEIGPGQGALTQRLTQIPSQRCIVIEIDRRMVEHLADRFGQQIEIINQDVLTVDFCALAEGKRLKIIGNLPYHITSPILFHLIDHYHCVAQAVLMTQKEVAQRICANPGSKEYGILSVITRAYAEVNYLFEIKRGNFFPTPAVDSAVISLKFFKEIKNIQNPELFRKIVRSAFNFRRKTLKNSLGRIFEEKVLNCLDQSILKKRPEQLTVDAFKHITNVIDKVLKNETN